MSDISKENAVPPRTVEILNTPQFQALFRVTATVLLLFISTVAFVAVTALGDIKDLTGAINHLNVKLSDIVTEGRVTANTVVGHERRITALEGWRHSVAPYNLPPPTPPPQR